MADDKLPAGGVAAAAPWPIEPPSNGMTMAGAEIDTIPAAAREAAQGAKSVAGGATAPTEVCITIDTEFSINGAFAAPATRRPMGEEMVYCVAGGAEHGLGFLLDTFRAYGTKATFFVEALNTAYFGDAPMGRVAERILAAGQDIGLHLHPVWTYFHHPNWVERLRDVAPNDDCDGRSDAEVAELIGLGLACFERWGVPPPAALRTGKLRADRAVYRAMASHGLNLASNVGLAYFAPADPLLQLVGGRQWIDSVLEVPVLTYVQLALGRRRWRRLLAITACSWRETEALLWQARAQRLSPVVVLTHPFEFVKENAAGDYVRRNQVNKTRLQRLCRFVAANPRDFVAASFAAAGPRWLAEGAAPAATLTAPVLPVLARMVENKLNDTFLVY